GTCCPSTWRFRVRQPGTICPPTWSLSCPSSHAQRDQYVALEGVDRKCPPLLTENGLVPQAGDGLRLSPSKRPRCALRRPSIDVLQDVVKTTAGGLLPILPDQRPR